jgi:methylenetetrahydrofolate reductase (NADPH)
MTFHPYHERREEANMAKIGKLPTEQIVELYAGGFNAVHVYSMNKPDVARTIQENVSKILGI